MTSTSDAKDGDRDDKAEARTEWAEDRTLMANERTFSSWTGTGLGAIGVALGMTAVFRAAEPKWLAKLVATIFVAGAIYLFWQAWRNACRTHARLQESDVEAVPQQGYTRVAGIMTLGAVGALIILWSL